MRQLTQLLIIILITSCSSYNKVLKTKNMTEKYVAAKKYYDNKDYFRAIPLFEELLSHYKGTDSSEMLYYYYSYSHYGMGDFENAGYHFKNFTETFYNSKKTEECFFMYAKCEYHNSMPFYLDQRSTTNGIEKLQLFINLFPNSDKIVECNGYIDELRAKLQKKAYENAYLYYKIGDYKAAVTAFKSVITDYPGIENMDEIQFLTVKSAYLLAKNSIDSKKLERHEEVLEEFKEINPESNYFLQAQDYLNKSKKAIDNLSKLIIKS